MRRRADDILVDYYAGAYGPTLRIDVHAIDGLLGLKALLSGLAEGPGDETRIEELPGARLSPRVGSVTLRRTAATRPEAYTHAVKCEGTAPTEVVWSGSPGYWTRSAGLVDGLLERAPRPGHQYLSDAAVAGVVVELAFME